MHYWNIPIDWIAWHDERRREFPPTKLFMTDPTTSSTQTHEIHAYLPRHNPIVGIRFG